MPPTATPEVSPILSREKKGFSTPPTKGGGSAMSVILLVLMLILVGSGLLRIFMKPAVNNETVRVVAAAMDIPPGTKLGFTNLHYINLPTNYHSSQMSASYEDLVGYTTRTFLPQKEPILKNDLFPGKSGCVGMELENDQRAMTLKLEEDALVDHSILPGDTVDVLCTSTAKSKKFTKTICQSVPVLLSVTRAAMLSQKFQNEDRNRITLALTPEQCEKVAEAADVGKIRLVLRNRLSTNNPVLRGTGESDIQPASASEAEVPAARTMPIPAPIPVAPSVIPPSLGPPPPVTEAPPLEPLKWVVEVFSGSNKQTYAFPQKQ
jgi:Flp pilus assembly protein CpaB